MAQPRNKLDCLTDEQGRFYRVRNGIVEPVATFTPLSVPPDGWQDATLRWQRSLNNFGMIRNFSYPMALVKEAARITRARKYVHGSEDKLFYDMYLLDKSFGGGWVHRPFYRGQIDMAKVKDGGKEGVSVNIMEGGLSKFLKAYENVEYEFDFNTSPNVKTVKMDGTIFKQKAKFGVIDMTNIDNNFYGNHSVPLQLIAQEGIELNIKSVDRVKLGGDTFLGQRQKLVDDQLWFYKASTNGQIEVKWNFKMRAQLAAGIPQNPGVELAFMAYVLDSNGAILQQFVLNKFNGPLQVYRENTFSGQGFISGLQEGQFVYPFMGINFFGGSGDQSVRFTYNIDAETNFEIVDAPYRHARTFVPAFDPATLGQLLIDRMTGGGYQFQSEWLSTEWRNLLTTSGDAIRGIPDPKLKISWSKFFKGYNVPCNLCQIPMENKMVVERKVYAFQSTVQQHLGNVKNVSKDDFTEVQVNQVKIGYENTNTEDINGRDEFNITHNYTSVVTSNGDVLELISPIVASMYEIEQLRIKYSGKDTTDSDKDERLFFLHCEKEPVLEGGIAYVYQLLRDHGVVTGILSPETAFNIGISPKRCLLAHGDYLRSVFYWQEASKLVFETSNKNASLKTVKGGLTIEEKSDVVVGDLASPLFKPLLLKFEGPVPLSITRTMELGVNGTFTAYDEERDQMLYGFPFEIGLQPSTRPAQETVLICSPLQDLTKFIY